MLPENSSVDQRVRLIMNQTIKTPGTGHWPGCLNGGAEEDGGGRWCGACWAGQSDARRRRAVDLSLFPAP